jgi:hypothetical protein
MEDQMAFESARDPIRLGIDAAVNKLAAAEVPNVREYAEDPRVLSAVESALAPFPRTEVGISEAVQREQVAELVGLGALIRALNDEPRMSSDLIERIRRIVREIVNNLGSP